MNKQSEAERKKRALRDNLKRRKAQLREFKSGDDKNLSPRKDAIAPKSAGSEERKGNIGPEEEHKA